MIGELWQLQIDHQNTDLSGVFVRWILGLVCIAGTVTACDSSEPLFPIIGELPADVAEIRTSAEGQPSFDYLVLEIIQGPFQGLAILDEHGEVIWFHRAQGRVNGATRRRNGNFVFVDLEAGLVEVSRAGSVVRTLPQSEERFIHHDVIRGPEDRVWFLANDKQEIEGRSISGEAVWEWHPETGATRKLWSSFDHLDVHGDWGPRSTDTDWLHANSISRGPSGNLLISLQYLNQVISLDPRLEDVQWRLNGTNATVGVEGLAFSGQHTAAHTAADRILLFDNGWERTEERFSRAVEYEIDLQGSVARTVWEFRPTRPNWSRAISSARRLANGNTLVTFGMSEGAVGSTGPIEVYEVDAAARVTWHLTVEGGIDFLYRASTFEEMG